ncbi:G2/mitotic-specific cyclin-2-like [Diospyros lotus]|uniref:G2/mitotic-specific cyclin-2-like n=1 Tax=Diospyros lotus TaxID=55363 RepID=UPI002250A4FC|nr:G2/mitotic-specific cyclin-2-like [Diospyros lotus]
MVISDENNPILIKPTRSQGAQFGVEMRNNRRALGVINQNLAGAHPYHRVVNKRALSEVHEICDKNLLHSDHRPITRKYAAQIASAQPPCPEESKKSNSSSTQNLTIWEDCPITDVEEDKVCTDHPVPMALEQTETMPDEKDQMEVEMEDIFEDAILDIDNTNAKNPLAVADYVDDLYAYYRKMESCSCVSSNYMAQQFDISDRMRAILIDWLIEVHYKFELRDETLFLTVNLIDRFLAQQAMVRKKLQLVGLVAMLLACKYEEVSVPVVDDLIFISDKAYSRKELLEMERLMLNALQYNMSVPTPYVFMRRYLKAAESDKKLETLSFFLVELCLVEYEMLRFPPSFLAAAAVYTAQCTLYGFKQWTKTCEWYTSYSEDQLLECSKLIVSFHDKAAAGKLTAVHRKYSTSKLGCTAKCQPAHFLVGSKQ